ncbi:MAG: adenylate/guanylate cyclase domain-containing protein [Armatimonadota bacterium]
MFIYEADGWKQTVGGWSRRLAERIEAAVLGEVRTATENRERRYDSATLRKVVNLATRLQNRREEMLTEAQIEAIGAEIGLEREFVREALVRVGGTSRKRIADRLKLSKVSSLTLAFVLPLAWSLAALVTKGDPEWMLFTTLVAPVLLCGYLGYLTGKEELAGLPAMELILLLSPVVWPFSFLYLGVGLPMANFLGRLGARIRREHLSELAGRQNVSRQELLRQLFEVQSQLMNQRVRKAFLSVDVVGSSEMMRRGPELEAEYSFNQFRAWVEAIVRANNGTVRSAAGDGVMAQFDDDADAVRAAKQIQMSLPQSNAAHNLLPTPFRVRCGVSAGEVPVEDGLELGNVQSSAVYRAAVMQKRAEPGDIVVSSEVAPTALLEPRHIAPVPGPDEQSEAYSWHAGQREYGPNA